MNWIQAVIFAIQMLIKYGPKLWDLGKKLYDEIEQRRANGTNMNSDQKAQAFNGRAAMIYAGQQGYQANRKILNEFRENVWTHKNPGKERKPLSDPRLKIMPKGKTAGAKT